MTWRRVLAVVVGGVLLSQPACDNAPVEAPALAQPADVALSWSIAASGDGARQAFLKSNQLLMRFRDAASTRKESQVGFQPADTATREQLVVSLHKLTETLSLDVEVQRGSAALFRGTQPAVLRIGRTTSVNASLAPVVAAVRAPHGLATIPAYGDSLRLQGAALFATGDTIDGVGLQWVSLDPAVATVDTSGLTVARADGDAHVVVSAGAFADTTIVRVFADALGITVDPPGASTPLGSTRQYSAVLVDRRGNVITGRPVSWTSSDPSVLQIDEHGVAHIVGIGSVQIGATSGSAHGQVTATGIPIAPATDSLRVTNIGSGMATLQASVIPNGAITAAWFEWGTSVVPTPSALTARQNLGSGLGSIPMSAALQGLLPNTRYVARIVATNAAGTTISDTITFIIPPVLPTVMTLPTSVSPGTIASLPGIVNPNNSPTQVWFQWGTDPSLQSYDSTAAQTFNGAAPLNVSAIIPAPPTGVTIYYRIVGRSATGGAFGAILSFAIRPPPPSGMVPAITTDAATNLAKGTATLNGTANPNGLPTTVWFEWSADSTFATFATTPAQVIGSGLAPQPFSFILTPVLSELAHWYRAVASNAEGTVRGAIVRFQK